LVTSGTGFGKFLLVLFVLGAILTLFSSHDAGAWGWFAAALLLVGGLWIAGRPMLEVLLGTVRSTHGWTNLDVDVQQRGDSSAGSRGRVHYRVNIGTRTFDVDRDVYVTIQAGQDNTAFFTPITHRVINVVPTQQ
jgi:hypothetical protein